jgi:Flp pilus assembly protein protease CpaA
MNKKQLIALTTVTTLVAGAATIYLLTKRKREKRLAVVSNAGYEMAYDVHYPIRYKKRS